MCLMTTWRITTSSLSMNSIKTELNNDNPIYTHWYNIDYSSAHALVICGYSTDVTQYLVHNRITLMDCNKPNYETISYSSSYTSGTRTYNWYSSIK
jgi:hypothetical protein